MAKSDIDVGRIRESIETSAAMIAALASKTDEISAASDMVIDSLRSGGKILTAGNGGSAAEAMHFSEELVGRFRGNRVSLPSVSLVADSTALTCIGNDYGFDCVFSRQVEGLGKPGDVLLLFSTSGKARNLQLALDVAREKGLKILCFLGRDGGPLGGQGDGEIIVEGQATERIQEVHQLLVHLVLDEVEVAFPPESA